MHLPFERRFQSFANWNQLEIRNRVSRSFHWNEKWWLLVSLSWLTNQGSRWVSLRTCVQTDYISQNLKLFWKLDSCQKSLKIGDERQRQDNVQTGDKVQVKQTLISPSSLAPHPPPPQKPTWTFAFLYKLDFSYVSQHWFSNGLIVTFTVKGPFIIYASGE